jgi:glycosyltransferase involved in cell wall biosynthesis
MLNNEIFKKLTKELSLNSIKIGQLSDVGINVLFLEENSNLKTIQLSNYKYIFCFNHIQEIKIRKCGFIRTSLYNDREIESQRIKNILKNLDLDIYPVKVKISGHLRGIYSLAIMNRDYALELDKNTSLDIHLQWDESNPKFNYDLSLLNDHPRIIELLEKSKYSKITDVEIRNTWPVLNNPSTSKILIDYLAWEESKVSESLKELFSIFDEFFTTTNFVKTALENSGFNIPILNIGQGIDKVNLETIKEIKPKSDKVTFLHISSGIPRKGLNDLIDCFMIAFEKDENVQLIIKTYYNPMNTVDSHLKNYPNQKKIIHICKDYSQSQLENLYLKSDVYVSPSRGEGYNRPVAEAMVRNIPVIVTGWSGHMDFCNELNSYLVKYHLEDSNSHVAGNKSNWAKIDKDDLIKNLKLVRDEILRNSPELVIKINKARVDSNSINDWNKVGKLSESYLQKITHSYLKLGILSTWKTKCGIATFTESLLTSFHDSHVKTIVLGNLGSTIIGEDGCNVLRCWDEKNIIEKQHDETFNKIIENRIEHLLVEYHPGQHHIFAILNLILKLGKNNIFTTLDIHSTLDFYHLVTSSGKYVDLLKEADKYINNYIVHNEISINEINDLVDKTKIKVVTHGNRTPIFMSLEQKKELKKLLGFENKKIIATHGFMLPHKGHDLIAESLAHLKNLNEYVFLNVSAVSDSNSQSVIANLALKETIKNNHLENNYVHIGSFLTQEQIDKILQITDILVFPYKPNNESASGAIRNALLVNSPILVSSEKVFDDVRKYVITLNSIDPRNIAESIENNILNTDLSIIENRKKYVKENSWEEKMKEIIKYIKNER